MDCLFRFFNPERTQNPLGIRYMKTIFQNVYNISLIQEVLINIPKIKSK